jgi:hypothetical protein
MSYYAGCDLGPVTESTALAVLEKEYRPGGAAYRVRHLERFAAGTPYRETAAKVGRVLRLPELGGCPLALDRTGVGASVAALFRQLSESVCPVVISAGHSAAFGEDGAWRVPRLELVAVLQVLLQNRRLQVAADLPMAAVLTKELASFKARVVPAGAESITDWREGPHDDLVLSVALAAWQGERDQPDAGEPLTFPDTRLPPMSHY